MQDTCAQLSGLLEWAPQPRETPGERTAQESQLPNLTGGGGTQTSLVRPCLSLVEPQRAPWRGLGSADESLGWRSRCCKLLRWARQRFREAARSEATVRALGTDGIMPKPQVH